MSAPATRIHIFMWLLTLAALLSVARSASLGPDGDSRLLISRANDDKGKQDIFLGWMNNPALEPFKPFFGQIQQTLGPQSQQVSAQILDNVPGAKEVFEQISKWQEQFGSFASNFNPGQFIPGMPSGG